jgi:F-type H+-transporting ATPase subunit b
MLIDWFTVAAQMVNFVVLVGLMKYFLFGRLVHAIDAREQRIAARLAEAEENNRAAEQHLSAAQAETASIQAQHDQMIAAARNEAESEHKQMLKTARDSVEAIEIKWREDLEREKSAFLEEIRTRAANEILAIAHRVLADLACADLDRCALNAFLHKLSSLDLTGLGDDLMVRSGSRLPEDAQQRIGDALEHRLGHAPRLRFELAPQMPWGLELRANGRRIGWNPDTYLGSLEENLRHALEHHHR